MALDEARMRLRRQLEEAFGVDGATILMDQPPGGWRDLVTNETLRLELGVVRSEIGELRADLKGDIAEFRAELRGEMNELRAELRGEIATQGAESRGEIVSVRGEIMSLRHELLAMMEREFRAQTWRLITAMIALVGVMSGLFLALARA